MTTPPDGSAHRWVPFAELSELSHCALVDLGLRASGVLARAAVDIEPATWGDAQQLFALRRHLERWMDRRGIDQWERDSRTLSGYKRSLAVGQWYVVRRDGESLAGAVRLQWRDPRRWGPLDTDAIYIHDLMVHRSHAGTGLGVRILEWAEGLGRANGVRVARLDCLEDNPRLVRYYLDRGYQSRGRPPEPYHFESGPRWGILLEKPLQTSDDISRALPGEVRVGE